MSYKFLEIDEEAIMVSISGNARVCTVTVIKSGAKIY
jgi:hypothetical protein